MFKLVSSLASAGIALACAQANAADLSGRGYPVQYDPVAQPPAFTWQGFYAGAHGSFLRKLHSGTADKAIDLVGGIQVGYNHAVVGSTLSAVFGAELEGTYTGGASAKEQTLGSPNQRWLAAAKLRYGLVFDRALLFVTGGFATTQLSSHGYERDSWKPGYLLGGGIEYALTDHLSLKAEYNYLRFGDWKGSGLPGFLEKGDLTNHIGKAGLNYRF
ncbi:outer membrane protein [Microvirga rosea]|uniref:outer membrane protein n=1 Tax=Microvirga rosea TaxID=2715425 RepID=UPI001D09C626|nr:outer membrane beta-barrel protein [Microvirga rosea]MCB8821267.1 outer membrane beta-barrel protein [Microvirga rosea]